jgi:hypothetical protein
MPLIVIMLSVIVYFFAMGAALILGLISAKARDLQSLTVCAFVELCAAARLLILLGWRI